jgi:hypothetical protein
MKQGPSLVCQHIENLSSDALEDYAEIVRAIVDRRHGVYALYKRGKLYYVGLATNLRGRLKQHLRDRHRGLWDRFSVYLTIDDRHLRELESLVMRIAQPKGNKQRGRLGKSENLMRQLKIKLKERHERELIALTVGAPRRVPKTATPFPKRPSARVPELARHLERAITLRATHKGKAYVARARRDGSIRVKRTVVASPTLAAKLVTGTTVNGWRFWRYKHSSGEWVRLAELRR